MTPQALCGSCRQRPAAFTVRRAYTFGTSFLEHVCEVCAPAATDCASFVPFIQDWMREDLHEVAS